MKTARIFAVPAVLAALVAVAPAASAAAAPVAATPYNRTDGQGLRRDIAQLESRLDRLDNTRRISGREEQRLGRSIAGLKQSWSAYSRGGFSPGERRSLAAQIQRTRLEIGRQANDHTG